jgi:hypothetical protein
MLIAAFGLQSLRGRLDVGLRRCAALSSTEENGREWIRTTEGKSQQIYSLPRLATPEPALKFCAADRL